MKAEFTNSTGMVFSGTVVGSRKERRACRGLRGLVDTQKGLMFNSNLPAFVRIRNKEGTEIEVHPSKVRFNN